MKLKVNFVNSVLFIFVVGIIAVRFLFHSGKCAKMKQVASVAFYSFDTCGQAPFFSFWFAFIWKEYMKRKGHCVSNFAANSSYANWNWYVHWFLMCRDESINKDLSSIIAMMAFTSAGVLYLERERRDSLESERRDSRSSRCLNCRNCPCQGRNPKVQQD